MRFFGNFSSSLCTELTAGAPTAHRGHVPTASPPSSLSCISVLGNEPTSTHTSQLHSNAAAVIESSNTTVVSTVPTPRDVSNKTQICHDAPAALTAALPPIPASLPHSRDTLNAPPSDFWISASSIVTAFGNLSCAISDPLTDVHVGNQEHDRQELAGMKLMIEDWLRQSASR